MLASFYDEIERQYAPHDRDAAVASSPQTMRVSPARTSSFSPISLSSTVLRCPHRMPKLSGSSASVSTSPTRDRAYLSSRFWKNDGRKYAIVKEQMARSYTDKWKPKHHL